MLQANEKYVTVVRRKHEPFRTKTVLQQSLIEEHMDTNERFIFFDIDVIAWAYANDGDNCGPMQDWDILLAEQRMKTYFSSLPLMNIVPSGFFSFTAFIFLSATISASLMLV
jgi:hypothetical protein